MKLTEKFRIEVCSDLDYEEMVADIYYDGQAIGIITQEEGRDKMKIKLYQLGISALDIPLEDYIKALLEAQQRLKEGN